MNFVDASTPTHDGTITSESDAFDVVVIGGGPAGGAAALGARRAGFTVALIEAELVGGECHYWGCIPSKALLRPLELLAAAQQMPGVSSGVRTQIDVAAVFARRDSWADNWHDEPLVERVEAAGVRVIRGHGRLAGIRRVEVTSREGAALQVSASTAVILATGSRRNIPDVPGLQEMSSWSNREAVSSSVVPESLIVLGGGAIGTEMATAWNRLGSRVTVVHASARLLPRMEPEAGKAVRAALEEEGVDVRLGDALTRVTRNGNGIVTAYLRSGSEVHAAEILIATGARPATAQLGLETVSLIPGEPLRVNESQLVEGVTAGWLLAVGDVTGRSALTHMGTYEARIAVRTLAELHETAPAVARRYGPHTATAVDTAVSQVVFTDPQVAAVGLTESVARQRYPHVRAITAQIGRVPGAGLHADGYRGIAKMIIDDERDVIVGMTFIGADVVDMIHAASIAIVSEAPLSRLQHAIPPFPTISEVWVDLLEQAVSPATSPN